MRIFFTVAILLLSLPGQVHAEDVLAQVIASAFRAPANVARDSYRHPLDTLKFFGLQANYTVVELSPGNGWYTEILAPYLRAQGQLIIGADDPASAKPEVLQRLKRFKNKLEESPALYDKVIVRTFSLPSQLDYAAPGSVDLVLTFRNVHNWMEWGDAGVRAVFDSAFRSLKQGGKLGIVEHRLPSDSIQSKDTSTGYVHQDYVIRIAQESGFRLDAISEINANPRDTADHIGGVWALPPVFVNKDADRAHYQAIGESDRMTLRFVKP